MIEDDSTDSSVELKKKHIQMSKLSLAASFIVDIFKKVI